MARGSEGDREYKKGMERKKPYRKRARGRRASLRPAREREDFPIIYVFSPPRFFALQQIKRNPHPWGTLLDYSLFSSCFHGSPFAFARARERARLADCISTPPPLCPALRYAILRYAILFLSLSLARSFSLAKKNFFLPTLAKFCDAALGA